MGAGSHSYNSQNDGLAKCLITLWLCLRENQTLLCWQIYLTCQTWHRVQIARPRLQHQILQTTGGNEPIRLEIILRSPVQFHGYSYQTPYSKNFSIILPLFTIHY